jgi:hypothetical protein
MGDAETFAVSKSYCDVDAPAIFVSTAELSVESCRKLALALEECAADPMAELRPVNAAVY